jgi:hypothetical protein
MVIGEGVRSVCIYKISRFKKDRQLTARMERTEFGFILGRIPSADKLKMIDKGLPPPKPIRFLLFWIGHVR